MNAKAVVLLLAHAAAAAAAGAVAQAWVHQITVGTEVSGSCTPGAWVDYELVVDEAMADSNLMFEVHDLGTSYNPEALMVAIWEGAVPSDRVAEHRTERASGKVWAVGMNNECFAIGTVTLGVRCNDHVSVNFKVKVVSRVAPVTVMGQAGAIIGEVRVASRLLILLGGGGSREGAVATTVPRDAAPSRPQVCPGEWVYHYVNTSALGIYGSVKHLRYRVDKDAGEGAGVVLTRHLAAPLKTVPPYVSLDYDAQNAGNATIDM